MSTERINAGGGTEGTGIVVAWDTKKYEALGVLDIDRRALVRAGNMGRNRVQRTKTLS